MLATPKAKSELFLASSLCDGLEDNNIKQVTTLLLSKEADPNVLIPSYGITPFHLVIGNDSEVFAEEVTKLFLRHGGNPNVTSAEGLTPVHVAAAWGRVGVLELLLANGGDPLRMDDERRTPFHYAFEGKYYQAITALGRYCADAAEKEEGFKYKRRLDKVLVNNGDMVAEYVVEESNAPRGPGNKGNQLCWNLGGSGGGGGFEFPGISSGRDAHPELFRSNVTVRKHRSNLGEASRNPACVSDFEEDSDREKVLVSEIIHYLSASVLSESSDEVVPAVGRDRSLKSHGPWKRENDGDRCSRVARKASLIPQLKRKVGEREGNDERSVSSPKTPITGGKRNPRSATQSAAMKRGRKCFSRIPVRLEYSPDDCIVSKSPNLIVPPVSSSRDAASRATFLFDEESEKSTGGPKNCEECHFAPSSGIGDREMLMQMRRKVAQSTPRRRQSRFYKLTSKKELKSRQNYVLKSANNGAALKRRGNAAENLYGSFDNFAATSSSPDFPDSHEIRAKGVNSCAAKLDECRYDDDSHSDEHASSVLQSETIKLPYILDSRRNAEKDKDDYYRVGIARSASPTSSDGNSSIDSCSGRTADHLTVVDESLHNNVGDTLPTNSVEPSGTSVHAPAKFFGNRVCNARRDIHVPGNEENASLRSSVVSHVSVQEEYEYEDAEEGVRLMERRYCVPSSGTLTDNEDHEFFSAKGSCDSTMSTTCSVPADVLRLDDHALRLKLTQLGDIPGPITNTTRQIYLKRLTRLEKERGRPAGCATRRKQEELCNRISTRLQYGAWVDELIGLSRVERRIFAEFTEPEPSRKWREGTAKTCFNYLLLDSRITDDLPCRAASLSESDVWAAFVSSVFYIGKGKRSRPYAHLYDAFHVWVSRGRTSPNGKIQRILDIWNEGYGVVCLHVFQNVIPVEAYTREAAMIDAVGLENLKNSKSGEYYGIAATWSVKEKCKFGRYLLYRAMQVLMHEGERQLFPQHL